jgi:diguanylate cyclase (GGDEF)-like protein
MTQGLELDVFAGSVARIHAARTEEDVFSTFHAACEIPAGSLFMRAYIVSRTGRGVRLVSETNGPEMPAVEDDAIRNWLIEDGARPGPVGCDGDLLATKLIFDGRVIGGVVLFASSLRQPAIRQNCLRLAQICAFALATCQQRRVSQLVLEALEESEEAISLYDANDGIVFTNDAYHRVFPHYPDAAELLGRMHLDLYRMDLEAGIIEDPLAQSDPEAYLAGRKQMADALVTRQRETQCIGGKTYIYTRSRSKTGATMSRRIDITEQALAEATLRRRERELHVLAFTDPLTGLSNRAHLMDFVGQLQVQLTEQSPSEVAVLLIDLNGFKFINDTYGHDCGDFVLKEVARRLIAIAPHGATTVRQGGDEFIVVTTQATSPAELSGMASAMLATLKTPIKYGDVDLSIGASIGIAKRTGLNADLSTLIADADLAMYEGKKQKSSTFLFFDPVMRSSMMERLNLLDDIRAALHRGEFELHYQPQFGSHNTSLVGFEALIRWHHTERGMVSPSVFIPLMEEYGLIDALGEWVLQTACMEAARWPGNLHIAVNVSPLQVRSGRFSKVLENALLKSGLEPGRLELEITESVFIGDQAGTRTELERWKALGVRIALDDFGSGYSSLSYLSAFPIDKIKIDRGFLGKLDPNDPDKAADIILRTIIDLGMALNMTVTAEGVERPDQLEFLKHRSCAQVQGFLLGRPLPIDQTRLLFTR